MLTRLQRAIIFPREYAVPEPRAADGVPHLQKHWIESSQGPVESWYIPAEDQRATVMFAHGNAELIDYWPQMVRPYGEMGVGVWLGEYRGYGRSAGTPSQEHINEDFVAMYDALTGLEGVDPGRVIFHGRSLGGGVMAQLARHRTPAAMILESTFRSITAMAAQFMMPRGLVADPFDTEAVLTALDVDVLLFHGRQDSVVPHSHAVRLAEVAPRSELISYDADHNDFPPDPTAYWDAIERFVKKILEMEAS